MGSVELPRLTWISIVGPTRSNRALSSARRAAVKNMTRRQTATFSTLICGTSMRTRQYRVPDHAQKGDKPSLTATGWHLDAVSAWWAIPQKPLQFLGAVGVFGTGEGRVSGLSVQVWGGPQGRVAVRSMRKGPAARLVGRTSARPSPNWGGLWRGPGGGRWRPSGEVEGVAGGVEWPSRVAGSLPPRARAVGASWKPSAGVERWVGVFCGGGRERVAVTDRSATSPVTRDVGPAWGLMRLALVRRRSPCQGEGSAEAGRRRGCR